jgi:hypothetical protein
MSRKQIIVGVVAGLGMFAFSIDDLFLGGGVGPSSLKWVLIGPGLLAGPAAVWLMWLEYRKSKSSK